MEEEYTLKQLVSNTFNLVEADDIEKIEEVEALQVKKARGKTIAYVHIGLFNYLFNDNLKTIIGSKISNDLRIHYKFRI